VYSTVVAAPVVKSSVSAPSPPEIVALAERSEASTVMESAPEPVEIEDINVPAPPPAVKSTVTAPVAVEASNFRKLEGTEPMVIAPEPATFRVRAAEPAKLTKLEFVEFTFNVSILLIVAVIVLYAEVPTLSKLTASASATDVVEASAAADSYESVTYSVVTVVAEDVLAIAKLLRPNVVKPVLMLLNAAGVPRSATFVFAASTVIVVTPADPLPLKLIAFTPELDNATFSTPEIEPDVNPSQEVANVKFNWSLPAPPVIVSVPPIVSVADKIAFNALKMSLP